MRRFVVAASLLCLPATAVGQTGTAGDSAAVSAVLASVRGANPMLCELAARTVEENGGWGGGPGLRAPEDPVVRTAMMVIRRDHVPAAAVLILAAALADDDGCVRRIAAPMLGRVEHPTALAALRQALRDERPGTREAAAVGLGYSGNPVVIPALLAGLQDGVARIRAACAMALGSIEDKRATGALVRLLREDRDEGVRAAAAWALGNIEG